MSNEENSSTDDHSGSSLNTNVRSANSEQSNREKRRRNGNGNGRSKGERQQRSPRAYTKFQSMRKSFIDHEQILAQHRDSSDEGRIFSRRDSRIYSTEVDCRKILDPRTRITLEWRDLNYGIRAHRSVMDVFRRKPKENIKELLIKFNGCVRPGTMVAFMGPSGAGKTTGLSLLSSYIEAGEIRGEIRMNGLKRVAAHRHIIGYVPQDTGFLDPFLTIREAFEIEADLVLPSRYSKEEKNSLIEKVMHSTGLTKLADSTIGNVDIKGISGGEKKRLAVGLELLRESKILFLDEPTSGLDASTARSLVIFLQHLAIIDNINIVMTIHQPRTSILSKFDEFYLFAGGKTVFKGNMDDALSFFQKNGYTMPDNANPADFFMDIVAVRTESEEMAKEDGERIKKLQEAWAEVESKTILPFGPEASPASDDRFSRETTRTTEIKALIRWNYYNLIRDRTFVRRTILIILFNLTLFSIVYFQIPDDGPAAVQNRMGFLSLITFDLLSMLATMLLIINKKHRVRQDRIRTKYRASSYYLVLWLTSSMIWAIPVVALIPVYYIVHLRYVPFTALLIFLGYQMLCQWTFVALGLLIGSTVNGQSIGLRIGILIATILKLFNGFAINTQNIVWILRWIRYISPAYFFQNGLVKNEFLGQTINGQPGIVWVDLYGFGPTSMMWCVGGLLILGTACVIFGFGTFYRSTKPIFRI